MTVRLESKATTCGTDADRRECIAPSNLAIEPGHGWSVKRMLAPGGRLRMPAAARVTEEAGVRLVELPLFGLMPVDDATWEAAALKPEAAPAYHAAEAVRRGLLECQAHLH